MPCWKTSLNSIVASLPLPIKNSCSLVAYRLEWSNEAREIRTAVNVSTKSFRKLFKLDPLIAPFSHVCRLPFTLTRSFKQLFLAYTGWAKFCASGQLWPPLIDSSVSSSCTLDCSRRFRTLLLLLCDCVKRLLCDFHYCCRLHTRRLILRLYNTHNNRL